MRVQGRRLSESSLSLGQQACSRQVAHPYVVVYLLLSNIVYVHLVQSLLRRCPYTSSSVR